MTADYALIRDNVEKHRFEADLGGRAASGSPNIDWATAQGNRLTKYREMPLRAHEGQGIGSALDTLRRLRSARRADGLKSKIPSLSVFFADYIQQRNVEQQDTARPRLSRTARAFRVACLRQGIPA